MRNRRRFPTLGLVAAAVAFVLAGHPRGAPAPSSPAGQPARRQITIGGRPVRVIDVHAHCVVPVTEIVKGTPLERSGGGSGAQIVGPARIAQMDKAGIDVQVLTINGYWWYAADRELVARIVAAQNEGLAAIVKAHPDRFIAPASVALQIVRHAQRYGL